MIRGVGQGFTGGPELTVTSGLVLWLDANDAATVTSSGGAVSAWADKSSGGRTFTQSTTAQKPTVDTTTFGGLNALSFSGDKNLASASALVLPANFSIFMVQFVTASLGPNSCALLNNGRSIQTGTDFFGHFAAGGTNQYLQLFTYQSSGSVSKYAYNTANLIAGVKTQPTVVADGNPANLVFRRNGAALSHTDSSPGVSTGLTLNQIGEGAAALYTSSGVFSEIVAYNRTLNSTEYAAVENYLKTKWGTP